MQDARRLLALVLVVLAMAAAVAPLAAQQPPRGEPQEEFVPVKDLPHQEQLPAAPLLIAAYAFVWVALLGYVWTVWRRLLKVEREMHDLAGRIKNEAEGGRR
jgi:CcmD family protein